MKVRFMAAVVLFVAGTSFVFAQSPVRLQFEILKNGSTVAAPEVSVASGKEASVSANGVGSIRFTPTIRSSDSLRVAFVIESGGKQLTPSLTIGNRPGSISWSAANGDAFVLRISWTH